MMKRVWNSFKWRNDVMTEQSMATQQYLSFHPAKTFNHMIDENLLYFVRLQVDIDSGNRTKKRFMWTNGIYIFIS